jgi:hypothetical protein
MLLGVQAHRLYKALAIRHWSIFIRLPTAKNGMRFDNR